MRLPWSQLVEHSITLCGLKYAVVIITQCHLYTHGIVSFFSVKPCVYGMKELNTGMPVKPVQDRQYMQQMVAAA